MLIFPSAKCNIGVINGTQARPPNTYSLYDTWVICNNMVITWILNSLDKEIIEIVIHTETVELTWKEIEKCYGIPSRTKVFQLLKEISSIS